MRILWLCNMLPGPVQEALTGGTGGGLWVDHVLTDLMEQPEISLHILCRGPQKAQGQLSDRLSYQVFEEPVQHRYAAGLEKEFQAAIRAFHPEVVHIWGTEYGHSLAMLRACQQEDLLDHAVVSIQGLCGIYARHYSEGLPFRAAYGFSLRDLLRWDNVAMQSKRYRQRGDLEAQALAISRHVIGRTPWDRACAQLLAPDAEYHFCNETLRREFYTGTWQAGRCKPHSIFISSLTTPIKGFHYLLEAMPTVLHRYPDAEIYVPGPDIFHTAGKSRLMEQTYHGYLRRLSAKQGLTEKVHFLGHLGPTEMKQQYLSCNVFVLPSTIENSPNSLGEAMLMGVPCAAADVGGVAALMQDGQEGLLYQSTAPYMLAQKILDIFDDPQRAQSLGQAAQVRAQKTHDSEINLFTLLSIYRSIQKEG